MLGVSTYRGNTVAARYRAGGLLCLLFLLLTPSTGLANPDNRTIQVVLSKAGSVYQDFANRLSTNIDLSGRSVVVTVVTDLGKTSSADRPLLYIPVGVRALEAVIQDRGNVPVLAALVPRTTFEELIKNSDKDCRSGKSCSAMVLDQPIERQIRLIKAIFGETGKIGLLTTQGSEQLARKYADSARRHRMQAEKEVIETAEDLVPGLERLLKRSQYLLAIPDPVIFNTATLKHILLTAYRYRQPVIAFSPGYVRAGALAAVYSAPEDVADDISAWLSGWLSSGSVSLPAPMSPTSFRIEYNDWVARSLGINIDSKAVLLKKIREGKSS